MENLDTWFRREVYHWRVGAGVVWTVLSVAPFFALYVLLARFSPLHPFQWILDVLSILMSLSFWGITVAVMIVLGAVSVYNSTYFTVVCEVALTRAGAILSLLKPPCLLHSAVFSLTGGFIAWCCSGLIGDQYATLSAKCSYYSEKNCFNERHLFLVGHGVFVGMMFHILFWLQQENCMKFPLLQRAKFFIVRDNLWLLMQKSLLFDLKFVKYFYLLYYLFGHIPRNAMMRNLRLDSRPEPPLNSLVGLLDLGLLWEVTLCGTLIYTIFSYSVFLYKVYNSEPFVFPIVCLHKDYKNKCLHNALGCSKFPLVKYLGFLDLYLLTKQAGTRRNQLFTLSQPGCHPRNWNNISQACISEIDSLTQKLEEHNWKAFISPTMTQPSGDNSFQGYGSSGVTNLTFRGAVPNPTEAGPPKPKLADSQVHPLKQLLENWKKKPVFKYMLSEQPDASPQRLFSAAQTQIWAVEALSTIVANSYTEDPYGIVQKSLASILQSLLNLQENLEKHFKLAPVVVKKPQTHSSANRIGLRQSLRASLRMSLYRIVNTFGKHLSEVKLAPDHSRRLKFFLDYKE